MEPSTPAALGGADNTLAVRPSIPLAEFLQALEAYPQPTRPNPCHRLPARKAVYFMLTGKADKRAKWWLEDNGHSPDYRLKLCNEDGEAVAVDAESLQEGANLPENVFVRLSDVALFFLHKSGSGWLFVDVPWSDSEGQPCLVESPEEAVKIDTHYIDYPEAEAVLARVLKDDPPGEEEIVFWLATGELTARKHGYANAGKVDCSNTLAAMMEGLEAWQLPEKPSCLDGIAQRIDTFYFSRQQLKAFRPATRWRSYGYVLEMGYSFTPPVLATAREPILGVGG